MAGGIKLKGNQDSLNLIIDMNQFKDFDNMINELKYKLSGAKSFYKDAKVVVTTQLSRVSGREQTKLKNLLCGEFLIKDCFYEEIETIEKKDTFFNGVFEGKTKFMTSTIRSGQIIKYSGNLVIVGDVNPGAEIYADGNIIIMGTLKGDVHAGYNGNRDAFISAYKLNPKIIQIAGITTIAPEESAEPDYPEVAKVKDNYIIVEPYIPNKFI